MKCAYLDTSFLVALTFDERGAKAYRRKLQAFSVVVSHGLIEAEMCAVAKREGLSLTELPAVLSPIRLIYPNVSLLPQINLVLSHGYLRGADTLHLAAALWFAAGNTAELSFLSLDLPQIETARRLGFKIP